MRRAIACALLLLAGCAHKKPAPTQDLREIHNEAEQQREQRRCEKGHTDIFEICQ